MSIEQKNILAFPPCDHRYSDEQTFTVALTFHMAGSQ